MSLNLFIPSPAPTQQTRTHTLYIYILPLASSNIWSILQNKWFFEVFHNAERDRMKNGHNRLSISNYSLLLLRLIVIIIAFVVNSLKPKRVRRRRRGRRFNLKIELHKPARQAANPRSYMCTIEIIIERTVTEENKIKIPIHTDTHQRGKSARMG